MQYKKTTIAATAVFAASTLASYVPSEPWSTLTPAGTYAGAITDYVSTFGIAVQPIATASAKAKRAQAISQVSDGQIQASTSTTTVSTATSTDIITKTLSYVNGISQITDGQIQATTATSVSTPITDIPVISQITDGQIQATYTSSSTESSATGVSQIPDGQIQATTTSTSASASSSESEASESESATSTSTSTSASASASETDSSNPVHAESCRGDGTLAVTLEDGVLRDAKGRIGSIVANRQFQFDGPPPQAGAIYAKGWGITEAGNLALGDDDVFYQCLSGNFYNLYDESIGAQCKPVHLEVVDLLNC